MDRILKNNIEKLEFYALTPDRWTDFETLFGPHGASSGCWCMYWRFPAGGAYSDTKGEPHRLAMRALVNEGKEPGLIAYVNGLPAAWVAVAPRPDYLRLQTSKKLYPVDDLPVWSIPCFFIQRRYRGAHLHKPLIQAAVDYAGRHGARCVEAYPMDVREEKSSENLFTGLQHVFESCGFVEVARRGNRPILRKVL